MRVFLFLCLCLCTGLLHGQTIYSRTDPRDSTVLANFNKEIQKYGWPSLWDETQYVVQWKVVSVVGPEPMRVQHFTLNKERFDDGSFTAETLPPCIEMLKDLPMLESFATNVGIKSLPPEIGKLIQIKSLGLGYNQLESLPAEIYNLSNLEFLGLNNNKLTAIPALNGLTKLTSLSIANNQLTELPASLYTLTRLTSLGIDDNASLTTLSAAIKDLVNLETLRADRCAFTKVPDELGQLGKLKTLYLNRNQLAVLPDALGNLQSLEELQVLGNQLTALPTTFSKLTNLTSIDFGLNQFTAFPASIVALPRLSTISASGNSMEGTLPTALLNKSTSSPITLNVSDNRLSGKFVISNIKNIRALDIRNNQYVLADLVDVYAGLIKNGATVLFNSQKNIGTTHTFRPANGDDLTLEIDNYTHLDGSVYTWHKNSSRGNSATVTNQPSLILNNMNLFEDEGVYNCVVTHPALIGCELVSNPFRVIRKNKAPYISSSQPVFRRNSTIPKLQVSVNDDFTSAASLVWSVPSATEHFSFTENRILSQSSITITPLDLSWHGTDTLKVTVTDEEGLSTTVGIPITMLSEVNLPPVIKPMSAIRLQKEIVECDGTEPACEPTWIWQSLTYLNPFIEDDYDQDAELVLNIEQEDFDRLASKNIFIGMGLSTPSGQWVMDFFHYNDNDTTFTETITIFVTDLDGDTTEMKVTFDLTGPSNQPPALDAIPEQVMFLGQETFPTLDLKAFTHDDGPLSDLEWSAQTSDKISVAIYNGIATVIPNSFKLYTDTVYYNVVERMNSRMGATVKVVYKLTQTDVYIAGIVQDESGVPLQNVLLGGFPSEVRTDAHGEFNMPVAAGWSGTITPSLDSYTFAPESKEVTNLLLPLEGLVFTGHIVTGIDDETKERVRVYPNPIVRSFSVKLTERATSPRVSLINGLGVPVLLQFITQQDDVYQYELKDATPGIYYLTVQAGNDTEVRKVMISSK